MKELLQDAAARAAAYLASLPQRKAYPGAQEVAGLRRWAVPLQDGPIDAARVLQELDEVGTPAVTGSAGGRYFGFVNGGSLPAAVAANFLATAWDQNAVLFASSPMAAAIEEVAASWLVDLLGLPQGTAVGFVTGATMANFTGLAAARRAVLGHTGWDVEARGLFGAPPITVVVGEEGHASLLKALAMLGLGRDRVVRVPVDDRGRMRPDAFPAIDGPSIVCLQAGNVNTGDSDPFEELIPPAHAAGAWIHVDGAFGLWAAACPTRAHLVRGVAGADSWAVDAHKWLNVPYDSGLAFVRGERALRGAMGVHAAYLKEGGAREPSHFTPELSRRARGVEVWAALRSLGRFGVADLVERLCLHATRFGEGLRAAGHTVLAPVVLNQLLVSFGDDRTTIETIRRIQEEGTCWCGSTVWQGKTAMRISVSSWTTTEEDVDLSLASMLRCAAAARGA